MILAKSNFVTGLVLIRLRTKMFITVTVLTLLRRSLVLKMIYWFLLVVVIWPFSCGILT